MTKSIFHSPTQFFGSLFYLTLMTIYNVIIVLCGPFLRHRFKKTKQISPEALRLRNEQWRNRHKNEYFRGPSSRGIRVRSVWFHSSSTGELEGLRPLIQDIKKHYADQGETQPVVLSYTSESARERAPYALQEDVGADFNTLFLPFEWQPWQLWTLLLIHKPRFLVIAEKEFWPNLFFIPWLLGIPVIIVNACIEVNSNRIKSVRKQKLFRWIFSYGLTMVYAKSIVDADSLKKYLLHPKIEVLSAANSRIESIRRAVKLFHTQPELSLWRQFYGLPENVSVFIAASIHPEEIDLVLALIRRIDEVVGRTTEWTLLLAPHSLKDKDVICNELKNAGISYQCKSSFYDPKKKIERTKVIVEDHIGDLIKLYGLSRLVYVGGGWGENAPGLHNVMEPAAAGAYILFGPEMGPNAADAEALIKNKKGAKVSNAGDLDRLLSESTFQQYRLRENIEETDWQDLGSQEDEYKKLLNNVISKGEQERQYFGRIWWRSFTMRFFVWFVLFGASVIQYGLYHPSQWFLLIMIGLAMISGIVPIEIMRKPKAYTLRLLGELFGYGYFVLATGGFESPYIPLLVLPFISAYSANPFLAGDEYAKSRIKMAGKVNGIALISLFIAERLLPKGYPPENSNTVLVVVVTVMFLYLLLDLYKISRRVLDFRDEVDATERVRANLQSLHSQINPDDDPFIRLEQINKIMHERVGVDSTHIMWMADRGHRLYLAVAGHNDFERLWKAELDVKKDGVYPCVRSVTRCDPVILQETKCDPGMVVIARKLADFENDDNRIALEQWQSIKSSACFPLIDSGANVLGIISFVSKNVRFFSEARIKIIQTLLEHLKEPLGQLSYTQRFRESIWPLAQDPDGVDPRIDLAENSRLALERIFKESAGIRIEIGSEEDPTIVTQSANFPDFNPKHKEDWELEAAEAGKSRLGKVELRFAKKNIPTEQMHNEGLRYIHKLASDLRNLNAILELVSDKVEQFTHNYAKPLGSMQSELDVLAGDLRETELGPEHVERLEFIRYRLCYFALINDQLAWEGRVLAGWHPEPEFEEVSINELFHKVEINYKPYCDTRKIILNTTIDCNGDIVFDVDPHLMFDVIDNLMINAVEAIDQLRPSKRTIHLRVYADDQDKINIVIQNSVADSRESKPHNHSSSLPGRPKLGHAFCRDILKRMRGQIVIKTANEIYQVTISLPVHKAKEDEKHG